MAVRHFRFFKDGLKLSDVTDNVSITHFNGNVNIGVKFPTSLLPGWYNGWIDEFRLSVGDARWGADFPIPVSEYPLDSYTKLLLHQNNGGTANFIDEAGHVFTPHGGATQDAAIKKWTASGYFNSAASSYISTPDHADFDVSGDSDFAIDFWGRVSVLPLDGEGLWAFSHTATVSPEDNRWGVQIFNWGGSFYLGIQYLLGGGLKLNETVDIGTFNVDVWYHFAVTVGDIIPPIVGPTMDQVMRGCKWFGSGTFQGMYLGWR